MSFVYKGAIDAMMRGDLAITDAAAAYLVSRGPRDRADDFRVDTAVIATQPLKLTLQDGAAKADRVIFPSVSGDNCVGVVVTVGGVPLAFIDDGFPLKPIGTDIEITFADGVVMRVR